MAFSTYDSNLKKRYEKMLNNPDKERNVTLEQSICMRECSAKWKTMSQKEKIRYKMPKRCGSAYEFFKRGHKKQYSTDKFNSSEFSKSSSRCWKTASDAEKKRFEDMAKADEMRYYREMDEYFNPPVEEDEETTGELTVAQAAKQLNYLFGKGD